MNRDKLLERARQLEEEAVNEESLDDSGHLDCCGNNLANWYRAVAKDIREACDE